MDLDTFLGEKCPVDRGVSENMLVTRTIGLLCEIDHACVSLTSYSHRS